MRIETLYDVGDKVTIDGCKAIVATVLAIMIRGKNTSYQVSWIQDGNMHEPWIEEWRIDRWDG